MKNLTLVQLRILLASLWCGFWMLTCISVMLAPVLRSDHAIGADQIVGVIMQISGIWLPPLSCFVAFWFPNAEEAQRARATLTGERVFGALALTSGYMVLVFALLLIPLYFAEYKAAARGNLNPGESLTERISEMVKFALLISPLVLAPVSYLTASHMNTPRTQDVKAHEMKEPVG